MQERRKGEKMRRKVEAKNKLKFVPMFYKIFEKAKFHNKSVPL
jgi:hypothetical protein